MKVQIISELTKKYNKEKEEWEVLERKINNVQEIDFDPLNDAFAISCNRQLRYLFLNKKWYRLSLKSYKNCRKRKLIGGV